MLLALGARWYLGDNEIDEITRMFSLTRSLYPGHAPPNQSKGASLRPYEWPLNSFNIYSSLQSATELEAIAAASDSVSKRFNALRQASSSAATAAKLASFSWRKLASNSSRASFSRCFTVCATARASSSGLTDLERKSQKVTHDCLRLIRIDISLRVNKIY